jgi:tetratricopeptide (TPR) repeat protein
VKWGFALLLLVASVARADDAVDPAAQQKANVFFEKAEEDYRQNRFQAAIQLFQDAYELVHDPNYLFNIAQSYRKAGDCTNANEYYKSYLREAQNAPNADSVRGLMRELAPCVEQRNKEHQAAQRAVELDRERRAEIARASAEPHALDVDRGGTLRAAGLVTAGVGTLGVMIGVVYGVKGHSYDDEIRYACAGGCTYAQIKSLDDAGHHANTMAAIGYIGGGLAVLAGASLYVWGVLDVEHVVIAPTDGGAQIGARVTF